MTSLAELTAQIITARVTKQNMTTDELQAEMKIVYNFLKDVESGVAQPDIQTAKEAVPEKLNYKQFFKKNEVICMVCNKGGFKTLKRHLSMAHDLKPSAYRKQFGIPVTQSLVAKAYSEQRKKDALGRGQGEILAMARATRAANIAIKAIKAATMKPVAEKKTADTAVKAKPAKAPAVKASGKTKVIKKVPVKPKAPAKVK